MSQCGASWTSLDPWRGATAAGYSAPDPMTPPHPADHLLRLLDLLQARPHLGFALLLGVDLEQGEAERDQEGPEGGARQVNTGRRFRS